MKKKLHPLESKNPFTGALKVICDVKRAKPGEKDSWRIKRSYRRKNRMAVPDFQTVNIQHQPVEGIKNRKKVGIE